MNGVHDMGGMQDMRLVLPDPTEPVFHERWEARMYALALATFAWGKFNVDEYRSTIEWIPPADYLRMSYYEKWLAALLILLERSAPAAPGLLESGRPAAGTAKVSPPLTAGKVASMLAAGFSSERPANRPARSRLVNPFAREKLIRPAIRGCRVTRVAMRV